MTSLLEKGPTVMLRTTPSQAAWRKGTSARQAGHQLAKKFSSTTFPRNWARETGDPSAREGRVKAGAGRAGGGILGVQGPKRRRAKRKAGKISLERIQDLLIDNIYSSHNQDNAGYPPHPGHQRAQATDDGTFCQCAGQ